jgi:hypothetical protein
MQQVGVLGGGEVGNIEGAPPTHTLEDTLDVGHPILLRLILSLSLDFKFVD